jgi:origin recognition complex subunit 2
MSKRPQNDEGDANETPSKRLRRAAPKRAYHESMSDSESSIEANPSPSKRKTPSKTKSVARDSPGAAADGLFTTPAKKASQTPRTKRADQSAKRRSIQVLAETEEDGDWDGSNALAKEILGDDVRKSVEAESGTPSATPSKRGRGRPPGAKNKRSPTPEGDIPPEERYFFQNRMGPLRISNNAFTKVKPLSHDEYFEHLRSLEEPHKLEKAFLMKLHARAFPQWAFELENGFNVCLYGYGSKMQLTNKFAAWLHARSSPAPRIVVINGYTPKLSLRSVLNTIGTALTDDGHDLKLTGQPQEIADSLLAYLDQHPLASDLYIIVNSMDSLSLRRAGSQATLAKLASHKSVRFVASADTPTFPLLWNSTLLDKCNFAFHDSTTFSPFTYEISAVDEVNELLGRKGRRAGGQEGIKYVLQSLPPNAQKLYRILVTEILSILTDDVEDEEVAGAEDTGVEYRILYDKACDAFVCTTEMNFRFLLKEFHDHQMITSRRDAMGTELMCVPLGTEEMQALLQDLVALE